MDTENNSINSDYQSVHIAKIKATEEHEKDRENEEAFFTVVDEFFYADHGERENYHGVDEIRVSCEGEEGKSAENVD